MPRSNDLRYPPPAEEVNGPASRSSGVRGGLLFFGSIWGPDADGSKDPGFSAGSLPFRAVNTIPAQPAKIVLYPDPVLARRAAPVEVFDEQLQALVERMIELMRDAQGAGLAAPQVGVSRRLFVIEGDAGPVETPQPMVFVNPEIELGGDLVPFEEGCLSIPDVRVTVRRPQAVRIKAVDVHGEPFELEDDDFLARVWQHEYDHLEGVLITDRMSPRDRLANRRTLKEMRLDFEQDSEQ